MQETVAVATYLIPVDPPRSPIPNVDQYNIQLQHSTSTYSLRQYEVPVVYRGFKSFPFRVRR